MAPVPDPLRNAAGFSLLELTAVLVIVSIITAMAMSGGSAMLGTAHENATRERMKGIENALASYRAAHNRLPCPADITIADGAANFGVEAATPGTCTGGTPAANRSAAGATNAAATGVEGAIPVVTLGLPNDYMYDGWGKRIRYVVDSAVTATAGFTSVAAGCTDRAITIKDANGGNRTTGAVYALISHGRNGHGGYTKGGVVSNMGSTNTAEQTNCHCTSSAVAGTYAPTYVQKAATSNPASATDTFDDIVTYRERWQLAVAWERLDACAGTYVYVIDTNNDRIQKLDSNGSFIAKWGSNGSGNGQFNFTSTGMPGIAVDSSGNVLVADTDNNRIQKFDADGNYISKFGTYGSANGQLNGPSGVAVDSSGNIWVTEWGGQRVQKFDSNGNYLLKFGSAGTGNSQFGHPAGLAIYNNNVYVGDYDNKRVQRFDLSGAWVATYDYSATSPQIRPAHGLDFDGTGTMYIPNSQVWQIERLTGAGAYQSTFSTQGYNNGALHTDPALAIDANNNIWVADPGNNRVQKFDSSGNWVASYGGGASHACTASPSGTPACPSGTADRQFNNLSGIATNRAYINAAR